MKPFVCRNDDYFFIVNWEEFKKIKESPLEATLMQEGEIPTDKQAVLRFDPNAKEELSFHFHPDNPDWNSLQRVEAVINEAGYKRFDSTGQVIYAAASRVIYVKDENAA